MTWQLDRDYVIVIRARSLFYPLSLPKIPEELDAYSGESGIKRDGEY